MHVWLPIGRNRNWANGEQKWKGKFIFIFYVFEPCASTTYFQKLDASGFEDNFWNSKKLCAMIKITGHPRSNKIFVHHLYSVTWPFSSQQ